MRYPSLPRLLVRRKVLIVCFYTFPHFKSGCRQGQTLQYLASTFGHPCHRAQCILVQDPVVAAIVSPESLLVVVQH